MRFFTLFSSISACLILNLIYKEMFLSVFSLIIICISIYYHYVLWGFGIVLHSVYTVCLFYYSSAEFSVLIHLHWYVG